jgi:hypothetical protein
MQPGIYTDMDAATYFADPCPQPSLTQSIAKVLLDRSPLHAWHAHPRLNPDYQPDDDTKFDVGNIAHKMLLGRGKEITVLEGFDDWRTKAAKEARAAAAAEGKLAVLGKHAARADAMAAAAREQLDLRGLGDLFGPSGSSETVMAWREGDIWLRQMIDWLSADRRIFADYKTTGENAAPHALARKMVNDGWPIQAAMAERGLDTLDPKAAGRRRYLFIVQEAEVPYALTVAEIAEATLTMGRKMLDHAVDLWTACIETNRWPGYPLGIERPQYPGWAETQWLDREIEHNERRGREPQPDDLIMAG